MRIVIMEIVGEGGARDASPDDETVVNEVVVVVGFGKDDADDRRDEEDLRLRMLSSTARGGQCHGSWIGKLLLILYGYTN